MSFNILAVEISPNTVQPEGRFTIKVTIEECNYERLEKYTHNQLTAYKHEELKEAKLNKN